MRYQEKVSTGKQFFMIAFEGSIFNLWIDKGLGQFDVMENVNWSTDKWEEFLNFAHLNYGTNI